MNLIKSYTSKGVRLAISAICYSRSGALIGGGCIDGSVQVWDNRANGYHRPSVYIGNAHAVGEVTCVKMFKDEKRIATRGMDDTLKLWDIRNTKHPSQEWKDLTNLSSKTNISISPDEKMLLTGTSVRKGFAHGLLMGFDVLTGDTLSSLAISKDSVVSVCWHPVLNQIIIGSADANIRILYDPDLSQRGITTSLTKLEKRRPIDQGLAFSRPILTPCVYEDEREKEMEKDPFNPNN